MNVVIINGSPRKNGSTATLLHEFEKNLVGHGVEVIFYNLIDQDIATCKGCGACYKLGHCVINDDADKLSAIISQADGIILGSSTMECNVSGLLKVLMDRGHFILEQLLHNKYSIAVTTYENYGGSSALKIIKNVCSLSGATMSGTMCSKISFSSTYSIDDASKNKIAKLSDRLYYDIAKHRTYPFQNIKHRIVLKMGIKPFVLKKGDAYAGVLQHWASRGIQ